MWAPATREVISDALGMGRPVQAAFARSYHVPSSIHLYEFKYTDLRNCGLKCTGDYTTLSVGGGDALYSRMWQVINIFTYVWQ